MFMSYTLAMTRSRRVLLSDGSGVTGRQTAGILHRAGHRVGVLGSDPLALTRFTRAVSRRHRTGAFGARPIAWLDEAVDAFRSGAYDVLVPTQEQVTVLSWATDAGRLDRVPTAVPSFDSLRQVQDKASAERTLARLGIPRPRTVILGDGASGGDAGDAAGWDLFPAFAKVPVATASTGVIRVDDAEDLRRTLRRWGGTVVVQQAVDGPLAMVQSVWDDGRLLAFHANLRAREGVRGGAGNKRSVSIPEARDAVERLGSDLRWTGGLSADVILGPDGPVVIDVNPRLVEPVNAARSGVDLVGAMLEVALHRAGRGPSPAVQPDSRPDVATHQLLLNLLGAAQHDRTRRSVLGELVGATFGTGPYRDSTEELTPPAHDWRTLLPIGVVTASTLVAPSTWDRFASGNVANYAIAPEGWAELCETRP